MHNSLWTDEETAILREMKAAGRSTVQIAARLSKNTDSVRNRWRWINMTPEQVQERRNQITMRRNGGIVPPKRAAWTEEQKKQLMDLRRQGKSWAEISKVTGRPSGTLYSKYQYLKNLSADGPRRIIGVFVIPKKNEEEWRLRQKLSHRDLTSALMGDPLPGYSALERRA